MALIPNAGKAILSDRIKGLGAEPNNAAWGTGAGAPAVTDVALFAETTDARVAGVSSVVTTNTTGDSYQVVVTLTNNSGAAITITNVGLFDTGKASGGAAGGRMFFKDSFPGVTLNNLDSIQFTLKAVANN